MALLHTLPADDGFSMPAEFDEQQAVVMIWPFRPGSWGADNRKAAAAFRNVAVAVSRFADVLMLAPRAYVRQAREALPDTIRVLEMEADDSWARDVAPTFVRDGAGRLRGVSWRFNAWGGETDGLYASWEKDDALAPALCARLGVDCYDASPFVMEGGRRPQRRRRNAAGHGGLPAQQGTKPVAYQSRDRHPAQEIPRRKKGSLAAARHL